MQERNPADVVRMLSDEGEMHLSARERGVLREALELLLLYLTR